MTLKLSETIYESIKNDIVTGKLDSRTFLSESETARNFGVSKAPVRDAFHLLCNQGYLISYPRRGYMVNIYTVEDLNKIQEIRIHMEKLSVKLAIERATDEEILSLKEFTKNQHKELDPAKTNNTLFHMRLAKITKNEYLPSVLSDLLNKVSQISINAESNLEKHNNIINALMERNVEKAIDCLEKDIYMMDNQ